MTLLLLEYNNYFNRIVKRDTTYADYVSHCTTTGHSEAKVNIDFDPKDGVDTEQVINWDNEWIPDYLVVFDDTSTTIKSRWWVIEFERIRGGQYKAVLHRDTVADSYTELLQASAFVEKGYLKSDDSAIFNKETITTNQIKKDEFLLKDESQCAWVVGYVAKDKNDGSSIVPTAFSAVDIENKDTDEAQEEYATFDAFYDAHEGFKDEMALITNLELSVSLDVCYQKLFGTYDQGITCTKNLLTNNVWYEESAFDNNNHLHGRNSTVGYWDRMIWKSWLLDDRQDSAEDLLINYTGTVTDDIKESVAARENVTIVDTDNENYKAMIAFIKRNPTIKVGEKYYKVVDSFQSEGAMSVTSNLIYPTFNGELFDTIDTNLNRNPDGDVITGSAGESSYSLKYAFQRHNLGFVEIVSKCRAQVPGSIPLLEDAPYHMFCIPYPIDDDGIDSKSITLYSGSEVHCASVRKSVALAAAQTLASKAGEGAIYDVQLLPYCPVRDIIKKTYKDGWEKSTTATWRRIIRRAAIGSLVTIIRYFKNNWWYYLKKVALESGDTLTLESTSVIKCKYNHPNTVPAGITNYDAYKIEINADSDYIKLYDIDGEEMFSTSYNAYVSNDDYLGVYFSELPIITQNGVDYHDHFADLTITQEEPTYVTKLDIGEVITSDIVKMDGTTVTAEVLNTIIWCTKSSFTFDISLDNQILDNAVSDCYHNMDGYFKNVLELGYNSKEIKVRNQTDLFRLTSPNYSNFFDISSQENKGIHSFNVDCTYKPFQPYIHVNPDFNGLYGRDFNDIRGLICGGDYGIALTSDAWATYQLNNKNYMLTFDRECQVLRTQNAIQKQNDIAGAIGGTITGAASGALTGAMVGGGPIGAIVGGVVGAGASLVGGLADINNNEILRNQEISLKRDKFGYQLQNIQALPNGLAKTSALTNNNKIFPFLEYYTCTDIEKEAIRNKLDYDGMTVMRVDKLGNYIADSNTDYLGYLKGTIIRINVNEDYHYVAVLNNELQKGVYIE